MIVCGCATDVNRQNEEELISISELFVVWSLIVCLPCQSRLFSLSFKMETISDTAGRPRGESKDPI